LNRFVPPGFGWFRDLPDFRDWTAGTPEVQRLLGGLNVRRRRSANTPRRRVDLREFFSEPVDQGPLETSPAHACTAMLEYFERRAYGRDVRLSRLFLHKAAQRMAMVKGNVGINLRTTLKAVACCGVPGERFWPYDVTSGDIEPDGFVYSAANRFPNLGYVRLDSRSATGSQTLNTVHAFLDAGFPVVFGIGIPASITRAPEIPYRPTFDSVLGGQALVAVGYDHKWLSSTRGALLVRNSWGAKWGKKGYGWLPYAFVEERLAVDFWTVLQPDWLASGEFHNPVGL
jgi:C1A family cysteine protease